MPREHAVGRGELRAHARASVILRSEQHALRDADGDRKLVHQMRDEARERRARSRRHRLDAIGLAEILNHPDLGQLVLLLLAARQHRARRRRKQVARVGRAAIGEDQRRLLRGEAHAGLLGLEDLVQHPRRLDRRVEVSHAAVLIDAKRVEVVAEVPSWHVLGAEVDALARHAVNAIRDRHAELVGDDALEVVLRVEAHLVRIPDAGRRHQLELEPVAYAPDDEAAVAVDRPVFRGQLHELSERVAPRRVGLLAPAVEPLADRGVVVAVAGRGRVFGRRQVVAELARDLLHLGAVLDQVPRLPHHHDALAHRLRGLARLAVLDRRVEPVRLRGVVGKQRGLDASLEPAERGLRRDGLKRPLEPRPIADDCGGVEGLHNQLPVKLTNVVSVVAPFW